MTEPVKPNINPASDPFVTLVDGVSPLIIVVAFLAGAAVVVVAFTLLARTVTDESMGESDA